MCFMKVKSECNSPTKPSFLHQQVETNYSTPVSYAVSVSVAATLRQHEYLLQAGRCFAMIFSFYPATEQT